MKNSINYKQKWKITIVSLSLSWFAELFLLHGLVKAVSFFSFSFTMSQCQLSLQEIFCNSFAHLQRQQGHLWQDCAWPPSPLPIQSWTFYLWTNRNKNFCYKNVHKSLKDVCSCQGCSTLAEKVNGYTNDTTFKDLKRII